MIPVSPPPAHWRRDRFYRRTLPAYWVFLACATHFPKARIDLGVQQSDKLAHIVGYGLLAFLFWRFGEALGRPLSGRFVWLAAGILVAYAALDELTQPFFNRGADLIDWLCDASAAIAVLAILEVQRRRRQRATGAAPGATPLNRTAGEKYEGHEAGRS